MKGKLINGLLTAALLAVCGCGCASTGGGMNQGDVALLAEDLRDVAREGTIYALSENPQWRTHIVTVRDQLQVQASQTNMLTFDALLLTLQGLPVEELKSTEARLAITTARITLRRAGRNVELGHLADIQPLAGGLAAGMSEGLGILSLLPAAEPPR